MSFLFGKRTTGALDCRIGRRSGNPANNPHQIQLDFVLANAIDDERPYLHVKIYNRTFLGLLDSGASRTIVGGPGWEILRTLNLNLKPGKVVCTVANGQKCRSLGVVSLPMCVRDRVRVIDVLVIPELPHLLILGTDFWRIMGVVPDLRRGEWLFSAEPVHLSSIGIGQELSIDDRTRLDDLVERHFSRSTQALGCTNLVEHRIVVNGPPIKQRYYPISPAMQKIVDVELDKMLSLGVVERSNSPWASPILLVPKKDKSYRFCVDYRKLNAVTERDAYPLPYVSNTLDKLRDANFLTSLDIKSAYWQIPIEEASRPYTAFTVPNRGLFQFCRLPFGLCNAPAVWMRFIDQVLGPELEPHVFVYLDDIIIVTPTFEKHLEVLNEVLTRIGNAGLTLNREKCLFCRDELKYLGYVVNKQGLLVDPDKVKAILEIPTPTSVSGVRRILGMASWYRRFIPNFATLVVPLTGLLRKNQVFRWTTSCEDAWSQIRQHLISAPILSCPDFNQEFIIQTDASNFGLGAVLTQRIDGDERVICYLSRSLSRAERIYSTTEKECLAVLWAIEKLRPYVEGSHFTVVTDHYSLCWLNKLVSPSGRLARWAVRLQQYDFTIVHRSGKDHVVPDALSRSVPVVDTISDDFVSTDKWYSKLLRNVREHPHKFPKFQVINGQLCKYVRSSNQYFDNEDEDWKIVVSKDRRAELIKSCHDAPTCGHLGLYKTFHRLGQKYFWPGMLSDVASYIRKCTTCIKAKPVQRKPAGCMGGHSLIDKPWDVLSIDIVGPLPRTKRGFNYILVVADCFSKFVLTFPLRKASTKQIVGLLEDNVFLIFGVPRRIICDNGVQFKSRDFRRFLDQYQVKPSFVSFYHPQANPVERVNRVIKTMLVSYVSDNHRDWDLVLPKITCAIRTAKHEVIGQTPYFVNFGREMNLTGERRWISSGDGDDTPVVFRREPEDFMCRSSSFARLYRDIRLRLQKAYEKSKARYDLRHRPVRLFPNQLIWRKNFVLSDAAKYYTAKLADKYVGPFLIHRQTSNNSYELKTLDGKVLPGSWSIEHLKAHPGDG